MSSASGMSAGGKGKVVDPEFGPLGKGKSKDAWKGKGKGGKKAGKAKDEKGEKKKRWGPGECQACGCTYISARNSPSGHGYCLCRCPEYGYPECVRTKHTKEHRHGARPERTLDWWTNHADRQDDGVYECDDYEEGDDRHDRRARSPSRATEDEEVADKDEAVETSQVPSSQPLTQGTDEDDRARSPSISQEDSEEDDDIRAHKAELARPLADEEPKELTEEEKVMHRNRALSYEAMGHFMCTLAQDEFDIAAGTAQRVVPLEFPDSLLDSILQHADAVRGIESHRAAEAGDSKEEILESPAVNATSMMREIVKSARDRRREMMRREVAATEVVMQSRLQAAPKRRAQDSMRTKRTEAPRLRSRERVQASSSKAEKTDRGRSSKDDAKEKKRTKEDRRASSPKKSMKKGDRSPKRSRSRIQKRPH